MRFTSYVSSGPLLATLTSGRYVEAALQAVALTCIIVLLPYSLPATIMTLGLVSVSEAYRTYHRRYVECLFSEFRAHVHVIHTSCQYLAALRPNWWFPILNWPWLYLVAVFLLLRQLFLDTEFSLQVLVQGMPLMWEIGRSLLSPNWELLPNAWHAMAQTLSIAVLGTIWGAVFALPISIFCAQNLRQQHPLSGLLYYTLRWVTSLVRATPTFLLGLIFVAGVGLGPFPGALAITLFSWAVLVKLFSETMEAVPMAPVEGLQSCGATWLQTILFAVLPQAAPGLMATFLYCLEINVHSATVLGLIGAQGVGLPIHEYLSSLAYENAAVFIYIVIAVTVLTDFSSGFVRGRMAIKS